MKHRDMKKYAENGKTLAHEHNALDICVPELLEINHAYGNGFDAVVAAFHVGLYIGYNGGMKAQKKKNGLTVTRAIETAK